MRSDRTTLRALIAALSLATLLLLLSACGFHLRGTANLPHETIYLSAPTYSTFANELKRAIRSGTNTRLVDTPDQAEATLDILGEAREKTILSLTTQGRVREFQLRYRVSYRLQDRQKKEAAPPGEILLRRDYTFDNSQQLAAEQEEQLLYRDMQLDAVQQLLRRLSAAARSS